MKRFLIASALLFQAAISIHASEIACPGLKSTAAPLYPGAAVAASDLDGDGKIDIVTRGSFLFGRGDGTFDASVPIPAVTGASSLFIADMNGDGSDDLITSKERGLGGPPRYVIEILPNNGNRSFGPPVTVAPLALGAPVRMADVTNDGRPDMILNADRQVVTLVNLGAFAFNVVTSGFSMAFGFAAADADNDGKPRPASLRETRRWPRQTSMATA